MRIEPTLTSLEYHELAHKRREEADSIMLAAIRENPLSAQYVTERQRASSAFWIRAIEESSLPPSSVPEELYDCAPLVKIAAQKYPFSFFAQLEDEQMLEKIAHDPSAFDSALERQKKSPTFIARAIEESGLPLEKVPCEFFKDIQVMFAAVKRDPKTFAFADRGVQLNQAFVYTLLEKSAFPFADVPANLKENRDFLFAMACLREEAITYILAEKLDDAGLILKLFLKGLLSFEKIPENCKRQFHQKFLKSNSKAS